jgi:hypothetical protein
MEPRREPGHAQDRRAARSRALARSAACARGQLQEQRTPARDRHASSVREGGGARGRRARRDAVRSRRFGRAGAALPSDGGAHRKPERLAGCIHPSVGPGQSHRPRLVHALQCLHQGVPRRRDRPRLPGRHGEVPLASRLRESVRRRRRDRFRAGRAIGNRHVRSRARPAGKPGVHAACAAARLFPCAERHRPFDAREAARSRRRIRKAEVLRLQGQAVRAQPQRKDRLHGVHRRLFGRSHLQREVAQPDQGEPESVRRLRFRMRTRARASRRSSSRRCSPCTRVRAATKPSCSCTARRAGNRWSKSSAAQRSSVRCKACLRM